MGLNKEDSTSELCIPVLMVQMQNLTFYGNAMLYPPRPVLSRERECRTNSGPELIRLPDQYPLPSIIQQCKMLESRLQISESLVDKCLEDPDTAVCTAKTCRNIILDHDRQLLLDKAKHHPEASIISQVSNSISWLNIWDRALDYGVRGTNRIQFLIKILTHPSCLLSYV